MNAKTLIIYAGHEINENFIFFCRNGYINDPNFDFVFIFNNPSINIEFSLDRPNIKIMTRQNIGYDFAGWTYVLFSDDPDNKDKRLYEKYGYFILLNSTVRGPFLPTYYDQINHGYWPNLFISKLDNNIKLVGTIVAFYQSRPFISSSFLVMDKIALDIGIKRGIFHPQFIETSKLAVVIKKEIALSNIIFEEGYNIKSMLTFYKDIDLKNYKHPEVKICHLNPKKYYSIDINPYEIIFIKTNRNVEPFVLSKYTEWNINTVNNINKIMYGISEKEAVDISVKLKEHIRKKGIIDNKLNLHRFIGRDPFPGNQKQLFFYIQDGNIEIIKKLNEFSSKVTTNFIFI